MERSSWQRTQVLLLAILLGLGVSLSCVQGGVMVATMPVAADDAQHGPGGCDGCGGGDHEGMDAGACVAVCGSAAQGLMPAELLTSPSAARTDFQIARLQLHGRCHSPDHGPPKILALG